MITEKVYFPGLNGLRSIAVLFVVIAHTEQVKNILKLQNHYDYVRGFGSIGVQLFFVLSGFLITFLLLKEREATSTVSVKKFYARRILRIFPLYYLIAIISLFILPHIFKITIFRSIGQDHYLLQVSLFMLLLPNIASALFGPADFVSHLWSIGVEEQFYISWAWIVKFVKKHFVVALTSIIASILAIRSILYLTLAFTSNFIIKFLYEFFSMLQIEYMAIGALGAYILFKQKKQILSIIYNRYFQIVILITLFISIIFKIHITLINGLFYSTMFLVVILNVSSNPKSIINLENRLLKFIGNISYGIYMYHVIAIVFALSLFREESTAILYGVIIMMTISLATLSYYLFEIKFLRLKDSLFTIIPSSTTNEYLKHPLTNGLQK